jgi:hypothetical protein
MSTRNKALMDALAILAADAGEQLAFLAKQDVPVGVDEIALDYDAIAVAAKDMLLNREITEAQCDCVASLNDRLKEMSGTTNASLWTAEALYSSGEWQKIRKQAKKCLQLFLEKPGNIHDK